MNRYAVMDLDGNGSWVTWGSPTVPTGSRQWALQEAATLNTQAQIQGSVFVKPATTPLMIPPVAISHVTGLAWTTKLVGGHHFPSLPLTLSVGGTTYDLAVQPSHTGSHSSPYFLTIELRLPGQTSPATIGGVSAQKPGSMFPDVWTVAEIETAIQGAFQDAWKQDRVRGIVFTGMGGTATGIAIEITGFLLSGPPTRITTAYPKI